MQPMTIGVVQHLDFIIRTKMNKTTFSEYLTTIITIHIAAGRSAPIDQPLLEYCLPPSRPRRSGYISIAPIEIPILFLTHLLYKVVQR